MNNEISAALSACGTEEPGPRARVLVVDDEVLLQAALRHYLKDDAIEVHCAGSIKEGFAEAVRLQPDLILLDLMLPDGDGLALCRRLRSEPATVDTSIIFMTVNDAMEMKLACFGAGAVDYITKPFVPLELRARVTAALRVRRTVRELARSAVVDALSGLWNRAYLDWRLREELSRAGRHRTPLSCIEFDIDSFKLVNDRFGHQAGDAALRHVARMIQLSIRTEDIACRASGDEMVVLLPQTALDGAVVVAERIRTAVETTPLLLDDDTRIDLTCSFGVAEYEVSGLRLLAAADAAMYDAKRAGRNCVRATVVRTAAGPLESAALPHP